jgi:hypothetical protein
VGGADAAPLPQGPISKAQEAVDKLLAGIRAKADKKAQQEASQGPQEQKAEAGGHGQDRGLAVKPQRDAEGKFQPGHVALLGPKPPKSIKEIVNGLADGTIEVKFKDPITGEVMVAPIAHLLAEGIVRALNDDDNYVTMIKSLLEYGIGKPKSQDEQKTDSEARIPRMIFLSPPKDPLAKPGDPVRPARIMGQIAGPNGEIIDYATGQPIDGRVYGKPPSDSNGLGEGDDKLEIVTDDGEPLEPI